MVKIVYTAEEERINPSGSPRARIVVIVTEENEITAISKMAGMKKNIDAMMELNVNTGIPDVDD